MERRESVVTIGDLESRMKQLELRMKELEEMLERLVEGK